jgi:hypothetical protein
MATKERRWNRELFCALLEDIKKTSFDGDDTKLKGIYSSRPTAFAVLNALHLCMLGTLHSPPPPGWPGA